MAARPQTLYGIEIHRSSSPPGSRPNDADGQPAAAVVSALNRTTSDRGELTRDEVLDTSRSTG